MAVAERRLFLFPSELYSQHQRFVMVLGDVGKMEHIQLKRVGHVEDRLA